MCVNISSVYRIYIDNESCMFAAKSEMCS